MGEFLTIPEIIRAAEEKLPREIWDFGSGGAETETTLRRNSRALERYALRQRVLIDVYQRDPSTTFLGHRLSIPVMMAPVGSISRFDPDGALAVARVSEKMGTIAFISTVAAPVLEEVAAGVDSPLVFQLYNIGDRDWVKSIVRRVNNAGYLALCLTADTPHYGRRERDLHNRYNPRQALQERPNLAGIDPNLATNDMFKAGLSWEYLDWLRDQTHLPLVLKGVMTPEDATTAVEHGVEVVYVSNHGGRQLDHAASTIEVLPEIVRAVGGRAEVLVDGGFVRGTDVIKAVALGAKATLIGKLQVWGLGADGEAGLERTFELLKNEMDVTMALIGARNIGEIGPQVLQPTFPLS